MTTQDFVLLTFAASPENTINGRTKLQKVIYFLGVFTEQQNELGYKPHYYGPYSGDVAEGVAGLCSVNFLDCKTDTHPHENGFEVTRYDYSLNSDGKEAAEIVKQREPELWGKIQGGVIKLQTLGNPDYMSLSFAAKVWLMLGEKGGKATKEELPDFATRFGWTLEPAQIETAADMLMKLGMVSTVPKV